MTKETTVDSENTREKILNAAQKLFVVHGFAGTSMGKIAKEASVNHSLIFHHYGNKQKLWLAVKQNIVTQNTETSPILPSLELPFRDFLKQLMKQKISFYRSNPDIVRMLNWQRLECDEQIGLCVSPDSQAWLNSINHYQHLGDIHKDLKSEFVLSFLLSIISSAALDPNMFISAADKQQEYLDFCVDCFARGVGKA